MPSWWASLAIARHRNDLEAKATPSPKARLRSSGPREYLLREWEYGGYEREIDLPEGYGSRVEASLTNGQLVVRVLRGPLADPLSMKPT